MDDLFIQKTLAGNSDSYKYLVSKYKDMAYSIAMSVIKNEYYAEEVIQISFLKAFDKLSSFNKGSKFSTWLYKIVINESFKHLKKYKTELVDYLEVPPDISAETNDSILKLQDDDQKFIINEALKRISAKESLVLRLFYLEQNSIEEMGYITGWSNSDLKVTLHRARNSLKYILVQIYKLEKKELY